MLIRNSTTTASTRWRYLLVSLGLLSGLSLLAGVAFASQHGNSSLNNSKPVMPLWDAYLALEPQGTAPPNGGTVTVGNRFVLDLWLNAGSSNDVDAQQSYLTFTHSVLQNALVNQIGVACVPTNTVTQDPSYFDLELQNQVCNGPGPCDFGSNTTDPGSIAFASANFYYVYGGYFRVAQIGFCAVAPGQAVLHWQFSPPAPFTRDTEIVDTNNNNVSDPSLFTDYVINVTNGLTSTPTAVPTCPLTTPTPGPALVTIREFAFQPQALTVAVGTVVRWTNSGSVPHTSTEDNSAWTSGSISPSQSFQYTFTSPGMYFYHCAIHTGMTGSVNVLAGCGPPGNTPTVTSTPPSTSTATPTPVPVVVGHAIWQGRPTQPNPLQQMPISLTLRLTSGGPSYDYPFRTTDASGFFTNSLAGVPSGQYQWRVKGPKYLANGGTITIPGAGTTNLDVATMRAGDCNDDNLVSALDFGILKFTFGKAANQPGYDDRADFDGNQVVNVVDVSIHKSYFGVSGAPPIGPSRP